MSDLLGGVDRHLIAGDLKRAEMGIARLLRVLPVDVPERAPVLLRRARVRLLAEKPDDALADLRTCLELRPELAAWPVVLELEGDIHFARFELAPVGFAERADVEAAIACYDRLVESCPDYDNLGWVLYQKGRILLSQGDVNAAYDLFERALVTPGQAPTLPAQCNERLGFVALYERRDPVAALACFDAAVQVYPAAEGSSWMVQLHIQRSRALREQGLFAQALVAARRALACVDTSSPDYRRALAEGYRAVGESLAGVPGREPGALATFVEFLRLSKKPLGVDVTWSQTYEMIGDLAAQLGRYEEAISAYTQALAFNPYHPLAAALHYRIARCYYHLGSYAKVIHGVARFLAGAESEPVTDYRLFGVLGHAHFVLGHNQEAARAYRQALALVPTSSEQVDVIKRCLDLAESGTRSAGRQAG